MRFYYHFDIFSILGVVISLTHSPVVCHSLKFLTNLIITYPLDTVFLFFFCFFLSFSSTLDLGTYQGLVVSTHQGHVVLGKWTFLSDLILCISVSFIFSKWVLVCLYSSRSRIKTMERYCVGDNRLNFLISYLVVGYGVLFLRLHKGSQM